MSRTRAVGVLLPLLLVVVSVHADAQSLPAARGAWLPVTLGAFMTAQGADLATSMAAFGKGDFHEANPVLRGLQDRPIPFAMVKMGVASAQAYGLFRLHRQHPRLALVLGWAGTATSLAIAVRNDRLRQR